MGLMDGLVTSGGSGHRTMFAYLLVLGWWYLCFIYLSIQSFTQDEFSKLVGVFSNLFMMS